MALSTRPSQRSDGRTALAELLTARAAAAPHTLKRAVGHGQSQSAGKADHLTRNTGAVAAVQRQARADRHGVNGPGDLDHQPAHADDPAINLDPVNIPDLLSQCLHVRAFIIWAAKYRQRNTAKKAVNSPLGLPTTSVH